ncbi:type II toxin-antitoxin system RelE/ParE family toxin [uncultured Duncaniella sp.]|uniref:type II toxin-antitoxin system RelE/ParE family toxin n=1 Tax=uncultured Duncaniella sp. TaxID=2768039 RepID=UPI002613D23F|nr:type II toxin-antitoxin system RelE/ParE family toxin [uncultured Duncaniella sp.]
MIVIFDKEYLRDLFESGKTTDKRHRYQPQIVKRYQNGIRTLIAAPNIEFLWRINSLRYEVLSGDKAGISSIRVNDQYRIEFKVDENSENPTLTICNIIELSNHYK